MVRAGGEAPHVFAHVLRAGDCPELSFPFIFNAGRLRRVAVKTVLIVCRRSREGKARQGQGRYTHKPADNGPKETVQAIPADQANQKTTLG